MRSALGAIAGPHSAMRHSRTPRKLCGSECRDVAPAASLLEHGKPFSVSDGQIRLMAQPDCQAVIRSR